MTKPIGFRDIRWGSNYKDLDDMIAYAQLMGGRLIYCTRANDEKMIGKAPVESLVYSFFDDKFYEVQVVVKGWENTLALLEHLISTLGKQHQFYDVDNHKLYDWEWDDVEVWCGYNKPADVTELVYTFKSIKEVLRTSGGVPAEESINRKAIVILDHFSEKTGIDLIQKAIDEKSSQNVEGGIMNDINIESLCSVEPVEFENIAKALLIKMGFNATTTKASGDGGVDIIAMNEQPIIGGKYIIQCKRYALGNNIGEPVIRELYGVMHAENANKGILITTSDFSKQAVAFAKDKAIELINGHDLINLCKKYLTDVENNSFFISHNMIVPMLKLENSITH